MSKKLLLTFIFVIGIFIPAAYPNTKPIDLSDLKLNARLGDVKAQKELARIYFNGEGVKKDYGEALKWYREAAEHGDINLYL